MSDKELINALIVVIAMLLKEPCNNIKALRNRMRKYDNIESIDLINKWVRSERGRSVMSRLLIDGASIETISEEINLSQKQASRVASQTAQNALIMQGFANETDALYNRLNNCPVGTVPVYGRQPIFTCNNNGCGCG